jgi:ATP-dependent phosphofructokinase / diphosphate-dependent phosphofructokinase
MKKIGILTGGGDCPGLNAVIRAIVRKAMLHDCQVLGFKRGWAGIINGDMQVLDLDSISGILPKGGTILGTSRTNPFKDTTGESVKKIQENFKKFGLDAFIAIGGEDTLGVASKLSKLGLKIVGVPKTIDNDISYTDFSFGFDTAVNIAMEAIDRLHSTAESHDRVMVVEIMGRHAGWIALYSGLAGGADIILIPEVKIDLEEVKQVLQKRHKRKNFSIVVLAEGAQLKESDMALVTKELDEFGHVRLGGIGKLVSDKIEEMTGFETRYTVLGHVQRGGTPTAADRVLGTRFGVKAVELVLNEQFGKMVSLQGNKIVPVEIEKAVGTLKTVDMDLYELSRVFNG